MLKGVELFTNLRNLDSRGCFSRIYDRESSSEIMKLNFVQSSISRNNRKGTLRGMHFQKKPSLEWKYVTCVQGSIFDALVDVRANSETYGKVFTIELSEEKNNSVLIPPGIAHGFITLEDNCLVHYQMSDQYRPDLGLCLDWNDKQIGIPWPIEPVNISDPDKNGLKWPVEF